MNRITTLEAALRRGADYLKKTGRPPAGARRPPAERTRPPAARATAPPPPAPPPPTAPPADTAYGPVSQSVATAMAVWMGEPGTWRPPGAGRRRRGQSRARSVAFALALDYRVPNLPMPLKQPSSMLCWATVATMLASWRDQVSYDLDRYIGGLGEPWASKIAHNQGLSPEEAPQLLATMGLQVETTQANFTAQAWEQMLRDCGPLWVTGDNNAQPGIQGIHAHILVGVHGPSDGDPTVDVIDPALGSEVQMPFSALVARYEQLATTPFAGLQIRHWPAGAQRAAQQSLAWARQAIQRDRAFDSGVGAAIAAGGLLYQVIKDATTTDGLSWRKSELRGKMIPGNSESKKALADGQYNQKKFKAHRTIKWDYPVIGSDNVGADFEVTYEYNGHCVANVKMTNTSYAPGSFGHELMVDTNITQSFAQERDDVVAVEIEIVWQFTYKRGSAGTYTQRWIVFGDGRPELFTETRS